MSSTQFNIPEPIEIPYFDHGSSLSETIRNSSKRRKMSKLRFACRKIRNIILFRMAYFCPLNSWRIKMHRRRGVHIGNNVYIGQLCNIDNAYPEYVFIEDDVTLVGEDTVIAHLNPFEHFKGGKYKLIDFGKDSETLEDVVIYQALYGANQIWVRPYDMFFSKVKLPDGTEVERFHEIDGSSLV